MKITLQDIIDKVAENSGLTKKLSEDFLREFLSIIEEALEKEGIAKIKGLGTFKLVLVDERRSVNVQTGNEIIIPQHYKVAFTPDKELKTSVNKPYAHLETYILSKDGPVDFPEKEDENEEDEPPLIAPVPANISTNNSTTQQTPDSTSTQKEETAPSQKEEKINIKNPNSVMEKEKKEKVKQKEKKEEKKQNEKEKENKGSIIIVILIIFGLIALALYWFSDSLFKPSGETTTGKKIEIVPEAEIETDLILTEDGELIITEEETLFTNPNGQQATGEKETGETSGEKESQGTETVSAGSENQAKDGEITSANKETSMRSPNRNPEFEKEYMFDEKFAYPLLDFMHANYPEMKMITHGTKEVTIKSKERLTLIALEHYGHKQFWVYLYYYNTDVIKNPNNVDVGLVIKVPKLDQTLADPKNPKHIHVAWDIQKYLLKM